MLEIQESSIPKEMVYTFIDSDDAIQNYTLKALMDEINKYPETDVLEYPIMERIGHP